jgi:RNA polymerase sigma-70 factor, ECF subfamily
LQSTLLQSHEIIWETGRLQQPEQTSGKPPDRSVFNAGPDADLIRRSLGGDETAFRAIVERYQDRVAATAIGMLGVGAEAEDVGQETFIRLYRALSKIRGESSLGTYLTRIAINLSLDAARRRQKRRFWFRIGESEDVLPPELVVEDREADEQSERRDWVQRAVLRLEPKHRAVVTLRLIQGYSTLETASLLGIPEGTVLSRLSRALDKLRPLLRPLTEE